VRQTRRERPRIRPHGLTKQKRQEIKEAFDLFDTDNSGADNLLLFAHSLISVNVL
jgi:Ca2+-binding EF-hand superfamily protein